jgi:hypothetical protein
MTKVKVFYTLVGWILTSGVGYSDITSPRSVLELEQSADLIIVGQGTADIQAGVPAANLVLQVSRVLKGDQSIVGSVLSVTWTPHVGGLVALVGMREGSAVNGLWFLQGSSETWSLMPVLQGAASLSDTCYPVPSGPITGIYSYGATASLADKIVSELAAAVEANNGYNTQLTALNYLMDQLDSPISRVFYQHMSTSPIVQHRVVGLSGLIRAGDLSALTSSASAAQEFEGYPLEDGILLNSIQYEFRTTDATSVAVLGQISVDSATPSLVFREAAAHALASIHTIDALPYLATLLADPDVKLRVEGIGGLGAFANGLQVQTTANTPSLAGLQLSASSPYRTSATIANFAQGEQAIELNEAAYLTFWRTWWSDHRASLGY